ncbi:MAG: Signal peptide peptidase SppA, 36K type [Microgenomates group bacterium GW2011_GWA1_Microgenomates_45_10]|nr:MAG: Signal peptide peptidase SppA, 36K type [Microgenomates group bacterium GW2011_GWA1_Microgenomates_45_10]
MEFKNAGDPNKPLTAEERKLFQRDLDIMLDNFISDVAHNRSIPLEEVRKLADGSSMLGTMALQNKLIDKIGGQTEVKRYLKEKIGEDPEICW